MRAARATELNDPDSVEVTDIDVPEPGKPSSSTAVPTVVEGAASSDIVILMLPDSDVVAPVLLGDGVAETPRKDALVVDMSSSEPLRMRALAERLGSYGSSGRSGSTENKWPNFIAPRTYDSGFALALMLKDMRIATGLAEALGVPSRLGEHAVELWGWAAEELPYTADHTEIARGLPG